MRSVERVRHYTVGYLCAFNIKKINTRCSEDLQKEFGHLEFLHNETLNSSMPKPQLNILGDMHDLEGIEKWYNERTEL